MKFLLFLTLSLTSLFSMVDFLTPDDAFKVSATIKDKTYVDVDIKLAKDIYLYEKELKAKITKGNGVVLDHIETAKAVDHHEELVFLSDPNMIIYFAKTDKALNSNEKVEVEVSYQGCSEQGLCYEPLSKTFTFSVDTSKLPLSSATSSVKPLKSDVEEVALSETDMIASALSDGNMIWVILTFLGFGLLLSLTPCVFPMIPILSSVIISQGNGLTTKRAFWLSLVYVLSMSVAYTLAGVLAGLFGANLQAALQEPWIIFLFSGVFVALSFSMFGMYELQMPNFIQSRLSKKSEERGGVIGVAIMGFLSALIVGPCIAAPLAGALIYIGQSGDALLGGAALFALSMGMGVPLLVVGTTAGKFMPQPGGWMDAIKDIFGVLMLGVAVWMLSRVVSAQVTMYLGSFLLLFSAIRLGALEDRKREGNHNAKSAIKTISVFLLMYAIAMFIGGLSNAKDLFNPLENLTTTTITQSSVVKKELKFTKVHSIKELNEALALNKNKKVMLDFYADWCVSCKELEAITFKDATVIEELNNYVLIKADITANDKEQKELSKKFGVFGPPALLFFNKEHERVRSSDVIGYITPEAMIAHLAKMKGFM
ncbi:MAG: protein-disulfide reductase DsbD [Helicobacteraceae bacterium]|nr:protein-disulfide reductase DsbD [Helicobacteraceae bacterium]